MQIDLLDVERRVKSGEGATLEETKALLDIVQSKGHDIAREVSEMVPIALSSLRSILTNDKAGDTAKVNAAKYVMDLNANHVVPDHDGSIKIEFNLVGSENTGKPKEKVNADQANAGSPSS